MVRTDGDSWDLASGVGATATAVVTSRALATREGIIDDRWAETLVRAVGEAHFVGILDALAQPADQHRMTLGMALRTRFFDEFVLESATSGIRQMVILASGLDARGYRLAWPPGTVVFDVGTVHQRLVLCASHESCVACSLSHRRKQQLSAASRSSSTILTSGAIEQARTQLRPLFA